MATPRWHDACAAGLGDHVQKRGNHRVLNDFYFKEAKRCNYLSRAAFKLQQIDDKCTVLREHSTVLDLGCFPGAWLQVACQRLGSRAQGGRVVGIDLQEMTVPSVHCDDRVQVCIVLATGWCNANLHESRVQLGNLPDAWGMPSR
jgi:hypothetical protein